MSTPQEIWDAHIGMENQDMRDYMPLLRQLGKGNVLEIGVRGGVSSSAFLLGMDEKDDGHLSSIDIDAACGNVLQHPRWSFIHGDSQTMLSSMSFEEEHFDTLLIDGDHHYDSATSDLRLFSPLVKRGGTILMHDVLPSDYARSCCPEIGECRQAWDKFCVEHPTWPSHILPGLFGMGVIQKA